MSSATSASGVFDCGDIPLFRRFRAWTDVFYNAFYPLEAEPLSREFKRGTLSLNKVNDLLMTTGESDPVLWRRRRTHCGLSAGGDFYLMPFPVDRAFHVTQRGRETHVQPGEAVLLCTSDPYEYHQSAELVRSVRIPGKAVRDRISDFDDRTAISISDRQPTARLLFDYTRSLFDQAAHLDDSSKISASRTFLDLLCLSQIAPDSGFASSETSVTTAHRQRVLRMIDANLHDPELTAGSIISRLGISERYIQKILSERDETLTGLIRVRRIEEAKKRILSSKGTPNISSIAYSVGFLDAAYFSRMFRAEAGQSPRAYWYAQTSNETA